MSWVDLVLGSDAAKLNPERARELVREAGGELPPVANVTANGGKDIEAVGDEIGNQTSSSESVVKSSTASPTATG